MARSNRVVIDNGIYHITSRVANQAFLLNDAKLKNKIVSWIYGIADFSGVQVLSWCIMNNHFHILLHVPSVPKKFWLEKSTRPEPDAFSMRPPECRAPRWTLTSTMVPITSAGDCPSEEAIQTSLSDGVPLVQLPRVPTRFGMSDEELIERIKRLEDAHSPEAALALAKRWERLRDEGANDAVEAEKDAFLRRMYNVSQFMKTLKQRISQHYNRTMKHSGHLWSDRFFSSVVENEMKARVAVAAYIDWNAPRAKLVTHAKKWMWCSFACAMGEGANAARARKGYEAIFNCSWDDARARMESIFGAKVSDTKRTIAKVIREKQDALSRSAFISKSASFEEKIRARLPMKFPAAGKSAMQFLATVDWDEAVN